MRISPALQASTNRVEILEHSKNGIEWLMFDFPGYGHYYATNSLVLYSKGCITLLVIDLSKRRLRIKRLRRWLSVLNGYAQQHVIVIGTHWDDAKVALESLDWFTLRKIQRHVSKMFPNVTIREVYKVNAQDPHGEWATDLRRKLTQMGREIIALRSKATTETDMKHLMLIRSFVQSWRATFKIMSWNKFVSKIVLSVPEFHVDHATKMGILLHELGDILRIGKTNDSLVVLDLQWLWAIIDVIVRPLQLNGIQPIRNGVADFVSVIWVLKDAIVPGAESKTRPLVKLQDIPIILQALESLQVLYCLGTDPWDDHKKPTHILIPSRLRTKDVLFTYDGGLSNSHGEVQYVGVRFQWKRFRSIPYGLLACLMCRINNVLNESRSVMPFARCSFVLHLVRLSVLVCLNRDDTCLDMVAASPTRLRARNGVLQVQRLIRKELLHGRWGRLEWTVKALCSGCCSIWKKRPSWKSCQSWCETKLKKMINESKQASPVSHCKGKHKFIALRDHLTQILESKTKVTRYSCDTYYIICHNDSLSECIMCTIVFVS